MNLPAIFKQPGVIDLLCDSAHQLKLAESASDSYTMSRHARASIMAAAFCLEPCANCLLEDLKVPGKLADDFERLPTLSKYDLYVRMMTQTQGLDRGLVVVQKAFELIQARNDFVHPKTKTLDVEIGSLKDSGENVELPLEMTAALHKQTQIPKVALFWSAENANVAIQALTGFWHYVFVNLLSIDSGKARQMLFTSIRADAGKTELIVESIFREFESELHLLVSKGFELSFLGLRKEG